MNEKLHNLRKRALMRAEHRGIKEMDIILGGFAREQLSQMDEAAILHFEAFMENNDQLLHAAFHGREALDPDFDEILGRLRAFWEVKISKQI